LALLKKWDVKEVTSFKKISLLQINFSWKRQLQFWKYQLVYPSATKSFFWQYSTPERFPPIQAVDLVMGPVFLLTLSAAVEAIETAWKPTSFIKLGFLGNFPMFSNLSSSWICLNIGLKTTYRRIRIQSILKGFQPSWIIPIGCRDQIYVVIGLIRKW
jgi:hypothetical protein